MGLALLSDLGVDELIDAVLSERVSALVKVKEVGTKTVQQILLDLRNSPALRSAGGGSGGEFLSYLIDYLIRFAIDAPRRLGACTP